MIRVVIADDEPKVCQLICSLVDWEALDMEVAGIAHNGIDALKMAQTLSPDLMISDIRMPGYDGLELLAKVKALRAEIEFIIISGYGHFEYAQNALKYGVRDYLLKPIKKAELTQTLTKMRDDFYRRQQQLSNTQRMRMTLQSDKSKLRAGLLANLLGAEQVQGDLLRVNSDYHFHFQPGVFQMLVLKVDCPEELGAEPVGEKVLQLLRGKLQPYYDAEVCFRGTRAYGLVNCAEEECRQLRRQLKLVLEELMPLSGILGGARFTAALGVPVASLEQVGESLADAQWNAAQRLIEGTGKVLEGLRVQQSEEIDGLLADYTKEIGSALEMLNMQAALSAVACLEKNASASPLSGEALLRLVRDAYSAYLLQLRSDRLATGDSAAQVEAFSLRSDDCCDIKSLFACLSGAIEQSLEAILQDKKQEDKRPIRAAKQYIQQNFNRPITLEEVSGVVGFSTAYFSVLFKKESGQNFLEYLSEVRMSRAKELLKETNMSISGICEEVGYNDLKHFTQSFKKLTGLKPNEFRKLYA